MAMIRLRVPPETAQLLKQIDLKGFGNPEPMDQAHITLLHLGDDVPIETLTEAIRVLYDVASKTRPFSVQTSRAATFPSQEGKKTPMIALVDSNALHDFHRVLQDAFDSAGVDFSKKWPEFKPHVTLGYSEDPLVDADHVFDETFPTVEWGAHEAVLFGGDKGKQTIMVTTPFSLSPFRQAVRQAMSRAANRPYEHDQEARTEKRVFIDRARLLARAAEVSDDAWMHNFARDIATRLERAGTTWNLSPAQSATLEKGFARYRLLMSQPAEISRLLAEKQQGARSKFEEEERITKLRIRCIKLIDTATEQDDMWVANFAKNVNTLMRDKKPLSSRQSEMLEKSLKRYNL
jgi:2'-5' RNA ligase